MLASDGAGKAARRGGWAVWWVRPVRGRDSTMQLHTLLRQYDPHFSVSGIPNVEIRAVRDDSRRIGPGDLFVARAAANKDGTKRDGGAYVADAAARGAVAVVTEAKSPGCPLPQIVVKDAARATSILANLFHGAPSMKLRMFGVTGTNGKTTTTYLIRHLLGTVNQRCGRIGTVASDDGGTRR